MAARARILIAEDDELTLELLATVLRAASHDVTAVPDGQAALAELRKSAVDLVLTDVQLPGASGLEILDAVTEDTPDTPVILITAYADPGAAMDAFARGADARAAPAGRGEPPAAHGGHPAQGADRHQPAHAGAVQADRADRAHRHHRVDH